MSTATTTVLTDNVPRREVHKAGCAHLRQIGRVEHFSTRTELARAMWSDFLGGWGADADATALALSLMYFAPCLDSFPA